jgi:alanyl-tRNA synthetase
LTEAEVKQVEDTINRQIEADLPVKMKIMTLEEAKKKGAHALFADKYGKKVKTYAIGNYSFEACDGPHVTSTGEIGGVKITKEKAVGAGRRRIYASLKSPKH